MSNANGKCLGLPGSPTPDNLRSLYPANPSVHEGKPVKIERILLTWKQVENMLFQQGAILAAARKKEGK